MEWWQSLRLLCLLFQSFGHSLCFVWESFISKKASLAYLWLLLHRMLCYTLPIRMLPHPFFSSFTSNCFHIFPASMSKWLLCKFWKIICISLADFLNFLWYKQYSYMLDFFFSLLIFLLSRHVLFCAWI